MALARKTDRKAASDLLAKVAVVVYKGRIEIRRHRAFGEDQVLGMFRRLEEVPDLEPLRGFTIVYGGKTVGVFGAGPR